MLLKRQAGNAATVALINRLKKLGWGEIAYKLMHPETGEGWTKKKTERAIADYLKFLTLKHLHPNVELVPSEEVDLVWHTHILDTLKYEADCEQVFGTFLHHFPYFGIRGAEDRQNLDAAFARTQSLFEEHFGIPMGGEAKDSKPNVCALVKKPSVCALVRPSVCALQPSSDQSRPCVKLNFDSFFPTEM